MSQGEIPATVDEQGALPDDRFKNAGEARETCQKMINADNRRSAYRAAINGLMDGNAPYPRGMLKEKKQSWRSNTNFLELQGYINAPQSAFYDLMFEANPCIDIDLDFGQGAQQATWEESIERNYTWLLFKRFRKSMNFHFPLQQREMLVHGLGVHVWPKAYANCWIPRTPLTGKILFPDQCSLDFDSDGDYFMLRDYVTASQLYGFIRNEGAASRLGWKPDQVWKALAQTSNNSTNNDRRDLEDIQRQAKAGDIGWSQRTPGLWVNYLFYKEFDTGKISLKATAEKIETPDYLFDRRNLFDSWPMVSFAYDCGGGTFQSLRGLGARAKDFFELSNRLKNAMADQVLLGGTIPLQQTSAIDPDKMRLMKFGLMSILPMGLSIAQGLKFPDLSNGPLALAQELKSTLRENNQAYDTGTPEPKDRETGQSFLMRTQDSAQMSKSTHGQYGSNLCQFHEKVFPMVIRASKMSGNAPYITMAKEMVARCKRDGVPAEALDHVTEIREVTSTGAGSAAARIQAIMTILQYVYPDTTEDRKINILHDLTAALVTSSKVDRYARSLSDAEDLPDNDDSFAMLENDSLSQGKPALVGTHQNHAKHTISHLKAAGEITMAWQQGQMHPEEAYAGLHSFGEHTAPRPPSNDGSDPGGHLYYLSLNPLRKQEFDQLHTEWLALSKIADQCLHQVQQQQDAQQQPSSEQQQSDQLQIGLAKVQSNAQLKEQKFVHDSQIKEAQFALNNRLKFGQAAANTRIKAVQTAAGIHLNKQKQLTNGSRAA